MKGKSLDKKAQMLLLPTAMMLSGIYSYLSNASDKELLELKEATEKPTQINCWWAVYQAGELLSPLVQGEIWRRSENKEKPE